MSASTATGNAITEDVMAFGPAVGATLITRDLDHSIGVYAEHLALEPGETVGLTADHSEMLGWTRLAGQRTCWLHNALGEPWLELIENPAAERSRPFSRYGWLSLEIAVQDVDTLGHRLQDSPFEVIGPPADLAMSDAIRAMQVLGPSGEVLYLTELKRPVPPFELPVARCPVDRLFIPVMLCPDRERALAHYGALAGRDGLRFETPITVLSAALGFDLAHEHPLATVQLPGNTLIEIDQADTLEPAPFGRGNPPTGIALIHFSGEKASPHTVTGPAGERYLLKPRTEAEGTGFFRPAPVSTDPRAPAAAGNR